MSRPWRVPRTKDEWRDMARVLATVWYNWPCTGLMPGPMPGTQAPCLRCQARAILADHHESCRRLGITIPESIEVRLPSPCLEEPAKP